MASLSKEVLSVSRMRYNGAILQCSTTLFIIMRQLVEYNLLVSRLSSAKMHFGTLLVISFVSQQA